jgi:hypothetical protein
MYVQVTVLPDGEQFAGSVAPADGANTASHVPTMTVAANTTAARPRVRTAPSHLHAPMKNIPSSPI